MYFSKFVFAFGVPNFSTRTGLATSWHHFTWPPPQHPATQNPQASCFLQNFFGGTLVGGIFFGGKFFGGNIFRWNIFRNFLFGGRRAAVGTKKIVKCCPGFVRSKFPRRIQNRNGHMLRQMEVRLLLLLSVSPSVDILLKNCIVSSGN